MRILLIGYLPPPYFGPSVTYQALLNSEFSKKCDVTFLDITVARSIADIERFRSGKLVKLLGVLLREFLLLLTQRFDFCCCPVSVNRNAFLRDAVLLTLAHWFGLPTVLYAHGNNLPDFHSKSSLRIQRLIERTARRAAGAVVLGEALRFNFTNWLPSEKIFVVPTGIEPGPVVTGPRRGGVLYLGALVREKGVFVLLEAARQCPGVRFVFAGNWYHAADAIEAQQLAGANVEFLGPVGGLAKAQALAEADLLAFPTFYYYETFGLVLLEAMQAGLPVIATRRAAIPEIIEDGVNGLLVAEQDAGDLATKIKLLYGDAALRERMGAANREKFQQYYTHEQYGRRMLAVFEELTRG